MGAAVGNGAWHRALDSMEARLCGLLPAAPDAAERRSDLRCKHAAATRATTVTWGEFLLMFVPSAGPAEEAYNDDLLALGGAGNGHVAARRLHDKDTGGAAFGAVSEDAAAMLQMIVPDHWSAGDGLAPGEASRGPRSSSRAAVGLAALGVGQLRREAQRLTRERAFLIRVIKDDAEAISRRAEAVHEQYRHEMKALHLRVG